MELSEYLENNYSSNFLSDFFEKSKERQAKTDYRMKLASKIYKAIKRKGWNNNDFAKAMNIKHVSMITRWLSGTHNFTSDTLFDIEKVLNIQLLSTEDPKPIDNYSYVELNTGSNSDSQEDYISYYGTNSKQQAKIITLPTTSINTGMSNQKWK